jgi:protein gp37
MSNIEWTDRTWNPVVGCTPVSAGCLNCYAATMGVRLEAMERPEYVGLTVKRDSRAVFTGKVNTLENRLIEPLSWRKPKMVFVNSMSDLFHEAVPFGFIDRVFAVMALCPRHTFQVLTKRPERMAEYLDDGRLTMVAQAAAMMGHGEASMAFGWPVPNIWLGTSCEDQKNADERIPHLLKCPAAVRFLSCEPLLGPIDLSAFFGGEYYGIGGVQQNRNFGIDWVIAGGESGPRARACDIRWIRVIVSQCHAAGVPCFVKQFGSRPHSRVAITTEGDAVARDCTQIALKDKKGGDPSEWPEDLRVREFPRSST